MEGNKEINVVIKIKSLLTVKCPRLHFTGTILPSSILFKLFSLLAISERNSLEFRFPTL